MRGTGKKPGDGACVPRELGVRIFDYIDLIRRMDDCEAVIAAMAGTLAGFGIEYYGFAVQSGSAEAFQSGVVVDRMHRAWVDSYFANGHAENNPSMDGRLNKFGPLFWSEMSALPRHGKRLRVMQNDAKAFGLYEGLCIPIVRPGRSAAYASFQGRHVDTAQAARVAMHAVALFTYDRLVRLGGWPQDAARLTAREAECLVWVAKGKTDWEIGEILSISENTVHWHIEQAKAKLNVATRIQAVVGAIHDGEIRI